MYSAVEAENEKAETRARHLRIYCVAVIAVMNQVTFGYDVGAISQSLEGIRLEFGLTPTKEGAITSALNFFAALGALIVSGELVDRIGRKKSLMVAAALLIVGGVVVSFAHDFGQLVTGRFLQGLGVGASWSSAGIYVTEIAPPELRGQLVSLVDVAINFGIIVGFCLAFAFSKQSTVTPWRLSMAISVVPPLLFAVSSPWLPESPSWLGTRGRHAEARVALEMLLGEARANEGPPNDVDDEGLGDRFGDPLSSSLSLEGLAMMEHDDDDGVMDHHQAGWCEALSQPSARYASVLQVLQQLTGTEAILYFAPSVLPSGKVLPAFLGNLGIGVAKFSGEVFAGSVADSPTVGRRALMVGANASCTLGLLVFGLLVHVDASTPLFIATLSWIMFSFSLGPGPFTTVFANEIVPLRHRAKSSAVAVSLNRLASAFVALTFLPLAHLVGADTCFYVYGLLGAFSTLFYYCTLPDTLGLDLETVARTRSGTNFAASPLASPRRLPNNSSSNNNNPQQQGGVVNPLANIQDLEDPNASRPLNKFKKKPDATKPDAPLPPRSSSASASASSSSSPDADDAPPPPDNGPLRYDSDVRPDPPRG